MYERLVENWLDSTTKRSYQPVFCQLLNARSYEVLHSTRHSPLEFGKDVIAVNPKGDLCAFQLKSNPGSRLTLNQTREIQPQLIQLVSQPVSIPGKPMRPHRSFLVTNGEVDEEARLAIREIGDGLRQTGYQNPDIELITRGTLLKWLREQGTTVWPSELSNVSVLLELLVWEGRRLPPIEKLQELLIECLLRAPKSKRVTASEIKRRVSSTALIIGVALQNFEIKDNHYATIVFWVAFCVCSIAVCEKFEVSFARNAEGPVSLAKDAILDSLAMLSSELQERSDLIEGEALADSFYYRGRELLLVSLMSVFWFWCNQRSDPLFSTHIRFTEQFIPKQPREGWLWGEAAIPQWLSYLWFLRGTDPTPKPDQLLAQLLREICRCQSTASQVLLASPYFSIEDVISHNLSAILGTENDPLAFETPNRISYSAESLMQLLVRTGMKQSCKAIWPSYSKLALAHFSPAKSWQYCLWRSPEGKELNRQVDLQGNWNSLVEESRDCRGVGIPKSLSADPTLLLLWIIIAPHRATPSAVRLLGSHFNDCWFIGSPIH